MARNAPRPQVGAEIQHALTLSQQGRLDEAEHICASVLAAQSGQPDALHLLGLLRHQQGRNVEALELIGSVLESAANSADALNNYGVVLAALRRHQEALARFEQALSLRPDHINALRNRADALVRLKRDDEALVAYHDILAREPDHLHALNEAGGVEERLGRPEAALAYYERALAVAPETVELHINKGTALRAQNRLREALASFAAAVAIDPECAEAHYNASLVRLCLGEFAIGWRGYEWRWRKRDWAGRRRNFAAPLWLGKEPIKGKTILLHAEQGFGDTLQFVRYVPLLARRGAQVILECPAELAALLRSVDGLAQIVSQVLPYGAALPSFDLHCPLLSLPLAFETDAVSIPAFIPYIRPQQERIAKWRERLPQEGRLRVGLCWAGSGTHLNDRRRSIPLDRFMTLLPVSGLDFIGLQKEIDATQAAILHRHGVVQLGHEFQDFADTAAVVAMLDLVISVDTAIAHLAGAMGKAVGLLLPFAPDWRWMLDRTDSPWYPTMRLFRQTARGDWDGPLGRLRRELADLAPRA